MKYRDFLQKIIYVIITPVIKGMIRIGFTPNLVTTIGFVLNIAATIMLLYAAGEMTGSTSIVGWSGAVILFAGLFDMMDGRLARIGNMSSMFGALWDSTLDRYSELFTLFGIAMYLILNSWVTGGVLTFLAMVGSVMVSYVRARAEGLGIECKVGHAETRACGPDEPRSNTLRNIRQPVVSCSAHRHNRHTGKHHGILAHLPLLQGVEQK